MNDRFRVLPSTGVGSAPAVGPQVEAALCQDLDTFRDRTLLVVVPDNTRPLDYAAVLRPLFDALCPLAARIDVLVALGLHRPMSADELAPLREMTDAFGAGLLQHDPAACRDGFHPAVLSADRVVTVGTVEPHQYAGFSGGLKALAIGCADAASISKIHGLGLLQDPKTRIGEIQDNPFQAAIGAATARFRAVSTLAIVPKTPRTAHWVGFGPVATTFGEAVTLARDRLMVSVDAPFDAIHLPVPPEKGASFYQACRAATYVTQVHAPAIRPGAPVIVEAPCPERLGAGAGELAFARRLKMPRADLLAALADGRTTLTGGEQRAFVLARSVERNPLVLVGAPQMTALTQFGILQMPSIEAASRALGLSSSCVTVNNVFTQLPYLRS